MARSYELAQERYAELGVDTERVLEALAAVAISLPCWQGDDVGGFEARGQAIGGGLAVTGSYPGRARTAEELRADFVTALRLIPGKHRFSLHASYAETGGDRVERNELEPRHFRGWIEWATQHGLGLDFNPTFFAHPKAADGFTLSHLDSGIRDFWIEHGIACRQIGEAIGEALGTTCITNFWIPDGMKDTPADRRGPRERLVEVARCDLRRSDRSAAESATPSKPSSSAWARRVTSSGRTSSTSVTRSPARSSSAWTPVISIPPR